MKKDKKKESAHGIILPVEEKDMVSKIVYGVLYAILMIMAIICLFPPLWVLLSAFKNINEFLATPPTIIPRSFEPEKIVTAWKEARFGRSYLNTLYLGAGQLVFSLLFNGLGGYVLSRLKPKGHTLIFTLVTWTMMMPTTVAMVPLYMTFIDMPIIHINLSNTFLPFWIMAGASPFYILLFKSFFDSIHMSYLEAARIDGCTELGIFFKIILPLSKPVMFSVALFVLNGIWGDFLWPYLILRKEELYTTGVKIYQMQSGVQIDIYFMSMLFVMLPPVIMYLLFQKYLMKGLSIGGVKG